MRLRRLILSRYGHLSDIEIAFPDAPDLHIIVGPNEAGKSTSLSAIGDALFRFPHRTQYDFLHGTRDLKVGVDVQARDGRQGLFFRRKGRNHDLRDADDQPVPETALAAFLGGATRERFDSVFGLNGAILRAGGKAILEGKGDAGSAIMSAYSGVHDYRRLADSLEKQAGLLFGDKRGQRAFHSAIERYQQARSELNDRRVDPEMWKAAEIEKTWLEHAQRENAERAGILRAEQTRLDRTRRTTPFRRRLHTLTEERNALGAVPDLPNDAASRFDAALASGDQATRDLDRERTNLKDLEIRLAELPPDDPTLAQADAIDALIADRQRIAAEIRDREPQRILAAQHEAAVIGEGAQLGLSLGADALAEKVPTGMDREKVAQALATYDRLEERQTSVVNRLADSDAKCREARERLGALPMIEAPVALRDSIERVRGEGRLDAELAEAERGRDAAQADLDQALSSLPHWTADAPALAALSIPLTAEIDQIAAMLDRDRQALREVDARLAEHDRELTRLDAEAKADAAGGDLPTEAAIQDARSRRDAAWALIRRAHLDGGAPITDKEREDSLFGPDTATGFEALTHAVDELSDRRTREQERVVAAEQRLRRQVERQTLRATDATLRQRVADQLEQSTRAWQALWQPSGLEPGEPPVMKEWLDRRRSVLDRYAATQTATRKHEGAATRHATAMADLLSVLPQPPPPNQSLAVRLKSAESLCKAQEAQVAAAATARKDLDAAEAEHRRTETAVARVETDLSAWQRTWAAAAALLALPSDTHPGLGRTALSHWERIDEAVRQRRAALDRVAQMTASIERYSQECADVVARVAPDLLGQPPLQVVDQLAARLAEARRSRDIHEDLVQRRRLVQQEIAKYIRQLDDADSILRTLRDQAKATNEPELRDALNRWKRLRELAETIAAEEAELHRQDDGKSLPELEADAEGIEFDTIPARIAEITSELVRIDRDERANLERLLRIRDDMAAMEKGRDAAAAAQAMETALADVDDVVLRYPPLRMAQTLLRAGIERFRRQQQGPLLQRASVLFARLTEGRYSRLDVNEDDDGAMYVVARQADGNDCRADRLSEGTLDQLYLALRLAAIEADAVAGEPLPFIGDDLLVHFDDNRAKAALRLLSEFSQTTQVILFTHHDHIAAMAEPGLASVHRLPAAV